MKTKLSIFPIIIAVVIGLGGGLLIASQKDQLPLISKLTNSQQSKYSENIHLAFLQEVRELILDEYWNTLNEEEFVFLHVRAIEQLTAMPLGDRIKTYQDLDTEILKTLEEYADVKTKDEFAVALADLVLANLEPFGRSRLYSRQLKQELVEKVSNIDPTADHYQTLNISPDASQEELEQAYLKQKEKLAGLDSPEAQQQLAQLEAARQTLASSETRARYDEAGVNPTMEWRLLSDEMFYLRIKQFSPTTVQELAEVTNKVDDKDERLSALILDLRGNIGGALDSLPYFLGPFIGNNQQAYQMLQQGRTTDFKTRVGWLPSLVRYKKVIILIDGQVQSSAEVMADVLQRYNVGVLVGTSTMGWGTVERVFPLNNQLNDQEEYSVFLVHHLTLRSDGMPIESNGIQPDIDITTADWQQQLLRYFSDQELVETVEKLLKN